MMIKNICVDLDGTLWPGDCLWLSMKIFLKKHPLQFHKIFTWWSKGRQILKWELAKYWDCIQIPFHTQVVDLLRKYLASGADIYLVTGSAQAIADYISLQLGFFKGAIGSSKSINLVGKEKAKALIEKFGDKNFIYIGNDEQDIYVWSHSHSIIAVNPTKKAALWLEKTHEQHKEVIFLP